EGAEPVAKAEEEQVIAPVVGMEEEQMNAPVIDIEEDLAALFGDDDFEDDASDGFDMEEVWEVNAEWLMASVTPPSMLEVPPPSVYEVEGPSTAAAEGPSFPLPAPGLPVPSAMIEELGTRLGNLEYGHRQLVQRVNQVSDAEVATGVTIGELGPRVYALRDRYSDSVPDGPCCLAGRCVAERHADPTAVDYSCRDGQPGEFTDAVYFGIG
ncbi:hypothetical protein Tco_0101454, partial [Tanacetum coccineum]